MMKLTSSSVTASVLLLVIAISRSSCNAFVLVAPSVQAVRPLSEQSTQLHASVAEKDTQVTKKTTLVPPKSTADIMAQNTVGDLYNVSVQKTYG
jgi:hypothetical protein